jgi:hypothetical protein
MSGTVTPFFPTVKQLTAMSVPDRMVWFKRLVELRFDPDLSDDVQKQLVACTKRFARPECGLKRHTKQLIVLMVRQSAP